MNTNTHFNRSVRREDIRNELVWSLRNKTKSDIVLYVNKLHGRMCYLNKEELSQEMKKWRKLRKENKVEILLFNNKNVFVEKEPYYTLTLQIVGQNEENNVGLDALSMFGFTHNQYYGL